MGRAPCCDKANVKKGPWSPEEDAKLKDYIEKSGTGGNWIALPHKAGLRRCGKSCRLRWLNYLRPNIKHGDFSDNEDRIICRLYASIGSRWSIIAAQLPGRTDNDIKNYWNTKLKKKLMGMVVPSSQNNRTPKSTPSPPSLLLSVLDQASPLASSPSLSSTTMSAAYSYAENNYYAAGRSLSFGYEANYSNVSSTLLNTSTSTTHSMHSHGGIVQDSSTTFPGFGGEASCSSSDGSSKNREAGHGHGCGVDFLSYIYNGVDDGNQKMVNCYGFDQMKPEGYCYGTEKPTAFDYGLEEIKQLISTNLCNNLFVDEIKNKEKLAY